MKKLQGSPLRKGIFAILAVAVLIPCLISSMFLYKFFESREHNEIRKKYETLLSTAEIAINRSMSQVESVIDVLCNSNSTKSALTSYEKTSDAVIALMFHAVDDIDKSQAYLRTYGAEILIISPNENILERSNALLKQSHFSSDIELTGFLQGQERSFWSTPRVYQSGGPQLYTRSIWDVICYYQKVYMGFNNHIGTVQCAVGVDTVFAPLSDISQTETLKIWVGDTCIFMRKGAKTTVYPTQEETTLAAGYTRVSGSYTGQSYSLTMDIPESEFIDASRQGIVIAFIILFAFYILLVLIANQLVKAVLGKLNLVMHAMTAIDLNKQNLKLPDMGMDEAGIMVQSINKLLAKIDCQHDELIEKERDKRKFERSALQFQINPHFLFNSLHWLRLKLEDGGASASLCDAVGSLGDVYRYNLSQMDTATILEEFGHIAAYVDMMRKLKDNEIRLVMDCTESLHTFVLPRFTLQPIVENAIKYGLVRGTPLEIRVLCEMNDGFLVLTVINDGKPIDPNKLIEVQAYVNKTRESILGHIGLYNLAQRLRLTYGNDVWIRLTNECGLTATVLSIPYARKAGRI